VINPLSNDELAVLAASTLADTAFLLAEPAPTSVPFQNGWICAVVPFDAVVSGRLVLAAPAALAAQVAADMLCVAPTDDDAINHAGSAVAELANIMAGVVVAEVFKGAGSFQLGLPAITPLEPPLGADEHANRVTLVNDVGQPLRVELVLGGSA
jgi:CheY-specific phosphatase CheX